MMTERVGGPGQYHERTMNRPASSAPFDAVLLVSFGGPQGPDDVRPFLANVLRGRRVPAARVEEVARHYEHFGGVSPITRLTRRQAAGLQERLARDGRPLPVYVGMRNWHPFLADTLQEMAEAGIRRAVGFVLSAFRSWSSCGQYRQDVQTARRAVRAAGRPDVEVCHVGDWHEYEGFIAAWAARVRTAMDALPAPARGRARLVFTAHSIPAAMAGADVYRAQLNTAARLVAERLGRTDWALVFQSRSGRPQDPWLEPDVCDYLRTAAAGGLDAAVLCPLGFVADHVEVLYDLDVEAAAVCAELGVAMQRAAAVNDDPRFLDMMADVVASTVDRYRGGRPLSICAGPEPPGA